MREPPVIYVAEPDRSYAVPAPDATVEGSISPLARVLVQDTAGRLVAAIELISPGNKDSRASRDVFAGKIESYLCGGIAVVVVDIVTVPGQNLHNCWAELHGAPDAPRFSVETAMYVTAYHPYVERFGDLELPHLDLWLRPIASAGVLPVMPLFLTQTLAVPIDLERTYLDTCGDVRLPDAA